MNEPTTPRRLKLKGATSKVERAVKAPIRLQTAGQADGIAVTTNLTRRHFEYLQRAAAKEGRTPEAMLERFVRIQFATDPTKGYAPAEAGSGIAVPGSAAGGGVHGAHPARGGE